MTTAISFIRCVIPSVRLQDFTFVCPTEIIAFSDRAKEFEKLNCQVRGREV